MKYRVICTTPFWHLNGVNSVSATLVRGVRTRGLEAEILLTNRTPGEWCSVPRPADVPMRTMGRAFGAYGRTRRLAADLSAHAPCVYLPGYDYETSSVSAVLPDNVVTIGVVHSDDPLHYTHVSRYGRYWNAIVCVSRAIELKLRERHPELAERILTIHNGVDLPADVPDSTGSEDDGRLHAVFASRIEQHQKRVFDLAKLLDELQRRDAPVRLTIAGGGKNLPALRALTASHETAGRVRYTGPVSNDVVQELFARAHVFLLTSDFEGLPISLLEAMARGCAPVVTDIPSGIPEVVTHAQNGYRLPVGDMAAFADVLARLAREPAQRDALAQAARKTIREGGFNSTAMTDAYVTLADRLFAEVAAGKYRRPAGKIVVPDEYRFINRLRSHLGHPVQRIRRLLRGRTASRARPISPA